MYSLRSDRPKPHIIRLEITIESITKDNTNRKTDTSTFCALLMMGNIESEVYRSVDH